MLKSIPAVQDWANVQRLIDIIKTPIRIHAGGHHCEYTSVPEFLRAFTYAAGAKQLTPSHLFAMYQLAELMEMLAFQDDPPQPTPGLPAA